MSTENQSQSIRDLTFDDEQTWFGTKEETDSQTTRTIKEVKQNTLDSQTSPKTGDDDEGEGEEQEVTFFGDEKPEKKPQEKPKEKPQSKSEDETEGDDEAEKEDTKKGKEKPKETVKAEEKGGDEDEEEKGDESGEEVDDKEKDVKFFTQLAEELVENGVLGTVELKKGEKIDQEKFFELQNAEVEARVDEAFNGFFEELKNDPDAVAFIQFKRHGGKTENFLKTWSKRTEMDLTSFDENDEKQVKKVINYFLTNVSKLDAEDVEDTYTTLKETGKDKARAKQYFAKIQEMRQQEEKELVENQKKIAERQEKDAEKYRESLSEVAEAVEEVGVIPILKNEKKSIVDYILKPTVKIKNGFVPQFNIDISAILNSTKPEDLQKLMAIAKLMKNNFKIKELKPKVQTEVVKTVQSKLKESRENPRAASGSSSKKVRSLADNFD
jgi:hypothetical protein